MSELTILFTSAGRRVELIRAFQRAIDELGIKGRVIVVDADPLAPTMHMADAAYIVPRLIAIDYVDRLLEICRAEAVSVIFPLIDPDISILSKHRESIATTGARVAVVSPAASKIVADKLLTNHFFQGIGLATPDSWIPGDRGVADLVYPVFAKPRAGSASRHTHKINDSAELKFFLGYIPDPIIQEYLPGPEITTDVICDLDGEVLGIVSRERIQVRDGEVAKGVTVHDERIVTAGVMIAKALPAIGPITVQCILRDGEPIFTEINARFGGGIPLGIVAGVDAPKLLISRLAGIPMVEPKFGSYQTGLYMTRFDDSFMLTTEEVDRLSRDRV